MSGIIDEVQGANHARGGEKGWERVGGSERFFGEKERRNIERFFFFIRYSISSSMRGDIIRDRALQKETLFNPRLVAFHPRSNKNNETDPSLSHKNFN